MTLLKVKTCLAVLMITAGCTEKRSDYCDMAEDCALGQACIAETHTCATSALEVSPTGFYVAEGFWWSTSTGPMVTGTVSDPGATEIIALVDGVPVGPPATITGSDWSLDLDDQVIGADTVIYFQLTGTDGISSTIQTFRFDTNPPVIALEEGRTFDEREDTIDFGSSEPVHTHGGTPSALSATECTDVYRYGYLLTDPKPRFGEATNANPIVFRVKPTDETQVDMAGAEYRVVQAGATLLDWTPIGPPDETGVYAVMLDAEGDHPLRELATVDGRFDVEVRHRDVVGNVAMTPLCWNHHVLPAPLQIDSVLPAIAGDAIPNWNLSNNPPLSLLINETTPDRARLFEMALIQNTAEPIHVKFDLVPLSASYAMSATTVYGNPGPNEAVDVKCEKFCNPDFPSCTGEQVYSQLCSHTTLPASAPVPFNGPVAAKHRFAVLEAGTFTELPCTKGDGSIECTIPARAANAEPKQYELAFTLGDLAAIRTNLGGPVSEFVDGGASFTANSDPHYDLCTNTDETGGPNEPLWTRYCKQKQPYSKYTAVDQLSMTFQPSSFTMATARVVGGMPGTYVTATQPTPEYIWLAGDDDLPGPN